MVDGKAVSGVFRVRNNTYAESRDLEAIPSMNHYKTSIVLDQGESKSDIPAVDQADLSDQFEAVLSQSEHPIRSLPSIQVAMSSVLIRTLQHLIRTSVCSALSPLCHRHTTLSRLLSPAA